MKKRSLVFIVSLVLVVNAYSQRKLDINDCRNLAISNNKELKMATAEERTAYYEKKEAFAKYFPELSFSGTYLRNQKNLNLLPSSITMPDIPGLALPIPPGTEIELPGSIRKIGEVDIKNIWLGGFNLVQPIFMGGKIVAYNDVRKYAEQLAKAKKDTKLTDVIVEVDNTYWQIVSLFDKKKLANSYVELLTKMESDIKIMEEEGVATKADRLSVSVKLNEAEVTQTKVDNGLILAKMLLCQICGLDINENIELIHANLSATETDSQLTDVNEAFANRSELKSLDLVTKMHKKNEQIAMSEFLPQLGFMASYIWTNPSSFNGFEKKFGGMWNLGLSLKVPLNFYSSSAKLNAAKSKTLISKYQFEEVKEKIELQVNQSVFKLAEANKKLNSSIKNVEKADENLRYAKVGFEEGVIAASDVLAAHTAWIAAHSELIDAQIDIRLCKVYLNQSLGKISFITNTPEY